jgi:hypothetical protein
MKLIHARRSIGIWSAKVAVAACAALCTISAWAATPSESEQMMVGTWYGEFAPDPSKPVQRFVTTRNADGSYSIHARLYQNGKVIGELRNRGLWGLSNGMYFTVTTEVDDKKTDPRIPDVINAYLVQALAGNNFEYVHVASGNRFKVVRVPPDKARLPD